MKLIKQLLEESAPLAKHTELTDTEVDHMDKSRDLIMAKYQKVASVMSDADAELFDSLHDKFEDLCDAGKFKAAKLPMNKIYRLLAKY